MEDTMSYVFERNNYYTGKILSAKDFSMEQEYFNRKRWLLNQYNLGSGILYGLDVIKSGEMRQEECVTVKPGIAIDSSGREIVIREPINQVLSELDSFSKVKTAGAIYLCLEHVQEERDAAMSVGDKNSQNFNKVKEGYRFVLESEPPPLLNEATKFLYNVSEVYKDKNVIIWHKSPKFVCGEKTFECSFIVSKRARNVRVKLEYEVEVQKLNKVTSSVCSECTDRSGRTEFEEKYKLKAYGVDGVISFKNLKVCVEDEIFSPEVEDVVVRNESVDFAQKLFMDYYHEEISDRMERVGKNKICLAKILLTTVECGLGIKYHIDSVEDTIFTNYIYPQFLQRFMGEGGGDVEVRQYAPVEVKEEIKRSDVKTGAVAISVSDAYKKAYYSDEIEHGLGPGNVLITTMLEEQGKAYTGDVEVFDKSEYEPFCSKVAIGGILNPQKGTLRIGVKIHGGYKAKEKILVRWWVRKG